MLYQHLLEQSSRFDQAKKRKFARQISDLIKATGKFEQEKVEKMLDLLNRSRADIMDRMATLPTEQKFSRQTGQLLKSEIEQIMDVFQSRAELEMSGAQQGFGELGKDFIDSLTRSQGRVPGMLGISPELIENATGRSADLIRSLTQRQIGKASDVINRGVITGRSPFQVAREMSKEFKKGLGQMEAIARTEMLGIHSATSYAQLLDMAETSPGLKKQWITVLDNRTRETHRAVHLKSIPVNEPFHVGRAVLLYPGDPGGPDVPGEKISCRCKLIPDFSEVQPDPTGVLEMPPVEVKLGGVARQVARDVKKFQRRR